MRKTILILMVVMMPGLAMADPGSHHRRYYVTGKLTEYLEVIRDAKCPSRHGAYELIWFDESNSRAFWNRKKDLFYTYPGYSNCRVWRRLPPGKIRTN